MRMVEALAQMELTMRRMVGRRLRYRDLVETNGLQSVATAAAALAVPATRNRKRTVNWSLR